MALIAHDTVAFVDSYSLENDWLNMDDEDQREDYDRLRKVIQKRKKQSRPDRVTRESILEVPKNAYITHAATASNVTVTVNAANKLTVSDATETVRGGSWDIAQMLNQADGNPSADRGGGGGLGGVGGALAGMTGALSSAASKMSGAVGMAGVMGGGGPRFIQGDRVAKLLVDALGRQIVIAFEKNPIALHVVLRMVPKEGSPEAAAATAAASSGKSVKEAGPAKHYFELKQHQGGERDSSGAPCIESIGWCPWNPFPVSSGPLVLGSRTGGQIWGARLEASGVSDVKRLFVLPNERSAILSVVQDRSRDSSEARHLTVYAATSSTLYIFCGRGTPEALFTHMAQDGLTKADFTSPLQHVLSMTGSPASDSVLLLPSAASLSSGGSAGAPAGATSAHAKSSKHNDASSSAAALLSKDGILVKRQHDTETLGFYIPCPTPPHQHQQHHHHHHHHATAGSSSGAAASPASPTSSKEGAGKSSTSSSSSSSVRPVQFQPCHTSTFSCFWWAQAAEQQGMAGQWMWTHKEGVSFGTLFPPGFFAAPLLHGTVAWPSLLDAPALELSSSPSGPAAAGAFAAAGATRSTGNQRVSSGSVVNNNNTNIGSKTASTAAAAASSGSSKSAIKVFSSTMVGFAMIITTDAGISCLAHPALLPWKTRGGGEKTQRRFTMSSLSGGGGGGGRRNEAMFGTGAAAPEVNEAGEHGDDYALGGDDLGSTSARRDRSCGAAQSSLFSSNQQQQQQHHQHQQQPHTAAATAAKNTKTAATALMLSAADVKERTFYYMASGASLKESRNGGFGALKDASTSKVFLYTPLEVYELHLPGLRRQMFPLFIENMFEMASLCTMKLQLHQHTASLVQQQQPQSSLSEKGSINAQLSKDLSQQRQQQQQQQAHERDFASRLQAIRGCESDCRAHCSAESKRLGFEAGKSLSSRLRCYSSHDAVDYDRAVVAGFLHATHMSKIVAGKISKYQVLLAREASKCLVQMGAFSAAVPILDDAHRHITVTEGVALLSSSPQSARVQAAAAAQGSGSPSAHFFFGGLSALRSDEQALLERDRLLAQEMYGRSAIQRMIDGRTIIGQYTAEIYCLVHWLVLVMVERCRRAEVMEDDFGENTQEDLFGTGAIERNTTMPTNPVDVHEVQAALPFITDASVKAVEHARAAVKDMTSEQLPRMSVFRHHSVMHGGGGGGGRNRAATSYSLSLGGGGRSEIGASSVFGSGASTSSGRDMSLLGALTQSLTAFIQHHMEAGNLSFLVVERAVLSAASPKLASLVFVIMKEFGIVLQNLIARGNFGSASRVLSNYCLQSQSRNFWRMHASSLMAHTPLDFLSGEFCENVGKMAFAPEDLVCMLAPAAYHVKYTGRPEHTAMCRSVVAVLRSYLTSMAGSNARHKARVLEKQTVIMMCHHNSDEELVDFISEALEADYIELGEEEVASRRSSFSGFALRICAKQRRVAGVAEVLFRQGHWFDAVRLLVRAGLITKAKEYAVKVPNADEQHKCWFEIVQRCVEHDPLKGSNDALEMLKESDGVLSVYDVFPELSEAVPMKALGSGLVLAVNEVAERMKQTHQDVETARQITQRQRSQGDGVRRGVLACAVDKKCDVCAGPLLGTDELVYYPSCGHGMHIGCQRLSGSSDAPGLKAAREQARKAGGAIALQDRCPLCNEQGLLGFLTAPIELPQGHPARLFGL